MPGSIENPPCCIWIQRTMRRRRSGSGGGGGGGEKGVINGNLTVQWIDNLSLRKGLPGR